MPTKPSGTGKIKKKHPALGAIGLLALILIVLFYRSFDPALVFFSNDGPVGTQVAAMNYVPANIWTGSWQDLNSIGTIGGTMSVNITISLLWVLQQLMGPVVGSVGFAKIYAPFALLILGASAWFFFRRLRLSPLAAILGALAAMLNSSFFSDACWGVATHEIALGMDFLALGLVVSNTNETPWLTRGLRLTLAGFCVGMNVMEGADIGVLYSLYVAAFVFWRSLADEQGTIVKKVACGISGVAVVAVFAGIIASQTMVGMFGIGLIGTKAENNADTGQASAKKAQHWEWATQWSEPKKETAGLFVPGVFGYKMDTPNDMIPLFQGAYSGGVYWGGVGRSLVLDRYFDSGSQGVQPPGMMRFSGGGNYCGILVMLIAAWTIAQSFRRQNSLLNKEQRKIIWFWTAAIFTAVILAWGRFAPFNLPIFYEWLSNLPGLSSVRNPSKFLFIVSWGSVILFAYGVHLLSRRYLEVPAINSNSLSSRLTNWWVKAGNFDRKWTLTCAGIWGASLLGWFIYASEKTTLVHYLQSRDFPDENFARQIIAFSISQVGWWLAIFAAALAILTLILAGYFAGTRAKWAGFLLGCLLVLDLGRANLPYVIHWDYKEKYEVGSLNPIEQFLQDKPYEHRVAKLLPAPLSTPSQFQLFDRLYGIEWTQHHFLYYNIQSLDVIQMSRVPQDLETYLNALRIGIKQNEAGQYMLDETTLPRLARQWELSNTRYLLGPAGFLDGFNAQFDPDKHRFKIIQRFNVLPKPGITIPNGMSPEQFANYLPSDKVTAVPDSDGPYALFEFNGALPRAKLYANWQVDTNDQTNLKALADLNFDPEKTVLVSTSLAGLPDLATNENSGTVEFKSYSPKQIVLATQSATPSVLLLNDKYDPGWHVTVDGKPAELLRCNYIMRGVYLPAGSHTVEFQFSLPNELLYVTLAAIFTGMVLTGILVYLERRKSAV